MRPQKLSSAGSSSTDYEGGVWYEAAWRGSAGAGAHRFQPPAPCAAAHTLQPDIYTNLYDEEYAREVSAKARATGTGPKPSGRQRQIGSGNLLRKPPATEEKINVVEEHLGMKLPDDYKAFLRISNGFVEHNYPHYIDVIAGTGYLTWKPPSIPEYTLNLLPAFESKINMDIPGVKLDRILNLNMSMDEPNYACLVEPAYMDEARKRLRGCYENDADEQIKRIIDMSVQNYYGGWGELESLDWGIMRFEKYYRHFMPGFRVYLEDLASRSGTFKWW